MSERIIKRYTGELKKGMKVYIDYGTRTRKEGIVNSVNGDDAEINIGRHTTWTVTRKPSGYWGGDCEDGFLWVVAPQINWKRRLRSSLHG